jgi:hypothetical protein
LLHKLTLLAGAAVIVSMLAPSANASIINVNSLLVNPSFELGNQASKCPVGWSCTSTGTLPGFSSAAVSSSSYTAGSDGLPNGLIVPDGSTDAFSPTAAAGNGDIWQSSPTQTINSSNTYLLDFWVGDPLDSTGGFPTFSVSWLTGGTPANLCGSTGNSKGSLKVLSGPSAGTVTQTVTDGGCVFSIPGPGAGQWIEYELSLTNANGSFLGVNFNNLAATNNQIVDLDMSATGGVISQSAAIPEPWSILMLGTALLTLLGLAKFCRESDKSTSRGMMAG